MMRLFGISLSTYIYAYMCLASFLALRVREGLEPAVAVRVGIVTYIFTTGLLALRHWIKPAKASQVMTAGFPWAKFLLGNMINLAGLGLLYSDGLSVPVFTLAAALSLLGANAVFIAEWRSLKRRNAQAMPQRADG